MGGDEYGYLRRGSRVKNTGLGTGDVPSETNGNDSEPGNDAALTPEQSKAKVEARFAEIRQQFIDEHGFMPYTIGPDGTPRRKGDTT